MDLIVERPPAAIPAGTKATGKFPVSIRSISQLAADIRAFELVDPTGAPLPAFSAGAHIDVLLPSGLIRQYSICSDPTDVSRYVVAVLKDPAGRGGSVGMHQLTAGDHLLISAPRNHFPLASAATHHVFVAGGIGITPIRSMMTAALARGNTFQLYYCTRSPERTAFLEELLPLMKACVAVVHHDDGNPANGLDLSAVLREQPAGAHLYYCGPSRFMDAVDASSAHWVPGTRHCERFSPPKAAASAMPDAADAPFDICLARCGKTFTVPPGKTIVQILRENAIDVDVSCEEGYCGTCMTRYLHGDPIHRDSVLDEDDQQEFVMICCCRARSEILTLDL
ncbi:oxidoreductase (plasmid) [Cupriavidus sp. P-10]|uniref:PDR/VanB family oxidoreductase n=1 Tax=Cupriavidus sp. P-10 TaxID=2027911 RepID=UPI000E2E56C1|nr:PDR/VanB family oxidoreductase [Cupriavidus sp. P-10]BDB29573.1 oxidoreductase [Cupriavidus sp. P-10]